MRVLFLITLGVSFVLGSRKYNDISQYLDNILMNPGSSNFLYPTYEQDLRPFRSNYLPPYPNSGFPYRPPVPAGMLGCDFITSRINANITNTWQGASSQIMPPYSRVGYMRVNGRSNQKSMLKFNQFTEEDYFAVGSYNIPYSYDVRQRYAYCNSIRQPLHQGCNCRGDWAISAASAFADRLCIASNGRFNDYLSAHQLLSCCPYCSEGTGCDGGDSMSAWVYFRDQGVVTGSPWMNGQGCQPFGIQDCPADVWSQPIVNLTMTPTCSQQCYNPQQILPNPYRPYDPYYYQSSNYYINQPYNSYGNQPFNSYVNQPFNSYANQPFNSYPNQPLNSYGNQQFNSYLNQPLNSYANQPFSSYLNQPLSFRNLPQKSSSKQKFNPLLNQPLNSYVNQPLNSYINQPLNSYPYYPANYPYQPNNPFSYPYQQVFKTSTAFYMRNPSVEQIKREIYLYGPVTADIRVYEDLHCYQSGVYRHIMGDFLGYKTVKLLGWGQSPVGPYWIAANTWGNNWGEYGFFKLGMENDLDFTISAGRVSRNFYSSNYFSTLMK